MNIKRIFFALWPDHRQRERLRDIISPVAKEVEGRAVDRRAGSGGGYRQLCKERS